MHKKKIKHPILLPATLLLLNMIILLALFGIRCSVFGIAFMYVCATSKFMIIISRYHGLPPASTVYSLHLYEVLGDTMQCSLQMLLLLLLLFFKGVESLECYEQYEQNS